VIEGAMIPCRADVSVGDVRSALVSWAAAESGVVRMDRPLREIEGGRHFHVAAPGLGTGTLEVNFEPADDGEGPRRDARVRVYAREHWLGTWAGGAQLRLVEHLAAELGA
jgi:hypothetical protein